MRSKLLGAAGAIAVAVALALSPAASAGKGDCPPGLEGTAPYCEPKPDKEPFHPPVHRDFSPDGKATLTIGVPQSGQVLVRGEGFRNAGFTAPRRGTFEAVLRPTGLVRQHLLRRGWTRPKGFVVVYRTNGGTFTTTGAVRFLRR